MKQFISLISFALLSTCRLTSAMAEDTLDTLLPPPYQFRSHAEGLDVDAATRERIERMYKAAEPKYHDLLDALAQLTEALNAALVDDVFDEDAIARRMKTVLVVENELKLYQVHVRISLLSQVTAAQRKRARELVRKSSEDDPWNNEILAGGELDSLLPRPFWLRSRAEELGVDARTRARIERMYQAEEPKYHELREKLAPLTRQLFEALVADDLDEEAIVQRLETLLEVEKELKLHQTHVRTAIMSQLTPQQRRAARALAKKMPDADWQKVMTDKVERVRQLSQRLSDRGDSVIGIEERMKSIEETIATGQVTEGARALDQVIRDLEEQLPNAGQQR